MGMTAGVSAHPEILPELYDHWIEIGQTIFDSGRFYSPEPVLGRWLASRRDRDRLLIVGKGCHPFDYSSPPRLNAVDLEYDLLTSLDVLRTEWIDIYLLHRDDLSMPVGPILDALARHRADGRIRTYGASNWTTARLAEADAYARSHGLPRFAVSSPNLSLAVPERPVWPGCVTAGNARSRSWYERTQMPVMSWSPLARGYFERSPEARRDVDAASAFESSRNSGRRRRVWQLATQLDVPPGRIALSWVLHQPFPTMAVIGPRTHAELSEAIAALDVPLNEVQVRWLSGDHN
jgi:aryl-alcohol dehydrogenase-like predicted oxidoreductase